MVFKIIPLITFLIFLPNIYGLNGKQLLDFSVNQYSKVIKTVKSGYDYPSVGAPNSSLWRTTHGFEWTNGFYPGVLWQLFNLTKDNHWKELAISATEGLFKDQFREDTHDIGFVIMSSYGDGYRFTKNSSYPKIIVNAANSLAKRFNCTQKMNQQSRSF
jgi:unsaturated chondroitin disaccharide hydrolase